MLYIGQGFYRVVYALKDNKVIKIPLKDTGIFHARQEYETIKKAYSYPDIQKYIPFIFNFDWTTGILITEHLFERKKLTKKITDEFLTLGFNTRRHRKGIAVTSDWELRLNKTGQLKISDWGSILPPC